MSDTKAVAMENDISVVSEAARGFLRAEHRMLINGARVASVTGKTFPVIDPTSGHEVARVPSGDGGDSKGRGSQVV